MPDILDFGRFRLDVFKAAADARVDWLNAIASFNKTMADVAEKQIKIVREAEELAQLRAARKEYQAALSEVKKRIRSAERTAHQIKEKSRAAARLEWGELIEPALLTQAWSGLVYLVKQLPSAHRREVLKIRISSTHRSCEHYVKPRFPNAPCDDAPKTIKTAVSLFGWARKESAIPINASPAQDKLFEVLDKIDAAGATALGETTAQLMAEREMLLELRRTGWKAVQVADFPPK